MVEKPFIKTEKEIKEVDTFFVKGKPSINLSHMEVKDNSQLKFILQQKIEEIREEKKTNQQIVAATKDAEFCPEATLYIPDSNHPVLSKHKNSTMERVAGYQDASLVPSMYKSQIEEKKKLDQPIEVLPIHKKPDPEMPLSTEADFETNIDKILYLIETIVCKPIEKKSVSNQQEPKRGKEADFTMKVSREKMHSGGTYMPNEYRPYRPGG